MQEKTIECLEDSNRNCKARVLRMLTLVSWALIAVVLFFTICKSAGQSMPFDPREATVETVQQAISSGVTTCREVTMSFLTRIETFNDHINAIIALNPYALDAADALDREFTAGNATGPLFGVPILLKDNYDTAEMPTTGGCLDLAHSRPSQDAPAVAALKVAGAIILGKANLHELALEGLSVSSLGGQTINPFDSTRTPGGSSGGSAAAVAASFCVFATGTDTVNSLRSPASANSLFSCRPTRGLISRSGIIPVSYTQDAIGPIARTVKDVAIALTVMAGIGYDLNDNTTALVPDDSVGVDYAASLTTGSLNGLRLGVVAGFFNRTDSAETTPVNQAIDSFVEKLRRLGASTVPINEQLYNATAISNDLDVQEFEYRQELSEYLERPVLKGEHPESMPRLYDSGQYLVIPSQYGYVNTALVSSTSNATYGNIKQGIQNLALALQSTFKRNKLDALIYPEQKNLVVRLGAPSQSGRNGILAAVTGSPVVTVPAGFSPPTESAPIGVPIGLEILGKSWSEKQLLQIAYRIEKHTHMRRTPAFAREPVEIQSLTVVPTIAPNASNIPSAYQIGKLSDA